MSQLLSTESSICLMSHFLSYETALYGVICNRTEDYFFMIHLLATERRISLMSHLTSTKDSISLMCHLLYTETAFL